MVEASISSVRHRAFQGKSLVGGHASGPVLFTNTGLSFWGGVDPATGLVIDQAHPLCGTSIAGRILALPSGRGSCTGSAVLLELLLNDCAPTAIVVSTREDILTLGVIVAEEMFGRSIPVLQLDEVEFARLEHWDQAVLEHDVICMGHARGVENTSPSDSSDPLVLTAADRAMLGEAAPMAQQIAMRIIVRMARILGATELIDISQVHVDGCIYTGEAGLAFAEKLVAAGGRVLVPTTLNAISVDRENWRGQGTEEGVARSANALANAYLALGARPSFTCAPYLLETVPEAADEIAWSESNAVVFANSVLGARTMKYPDFLDILIALTGRAPRAGCHLVENRRPAMILDVQAPASFDDRFWPLLGYVAGSFSPSGIPLLTGLEALAPSRDDLKSFGAAFATTSGAPMFHILGITPEAGNHDLEGLPCQALGRKDLADAHQSLQGSESEMIDLVALGNPHFSLDEFRRLADLVRGRRRHTSTYMTVTTARTTLQAAETAGYIDPLRDFGGRIVCDSCWCTVKEPIVPPEARTILTNSGKYAHYGPGLTGKGLRFSSLSDCVEAAVTGQLKLGLPDWLS